MAEILDQNKVGQYVGTTQILDTGLFDEVDINSAVFKEILIKLSQTVNSLSMAVNAKESGQYYLTEFVNSNVYFNETSTSQFDLRPVFRKVVNVGALAAGAKNTAHGLTIGSTWSFTRMYGAASNTTTNKYYPIPGASLLLSCDATNVIVTNNTGLAFTKCMVVLEYLKQ